MARLKKKEKAKKYKDIDMDVLPKDKEIDGLSIDQLRKKFEHFDKFIRKLTKDHPVPTMIRGLNREMAVDPKINIIYSVSGGIFIHVIRQRTGDFRYNVIEPRFTEEEEDLFEKIQDVLLSNAFYAKNTPLTDKDFAIKLKELLEENTVDIEESSFGKYMNQVIYGKMELPGEEIERIDYLLKRNLIYNGAIEGFMRDPYIEDISCVGTNPIWLVHKIFGPMQTNVRYSSDLRLDKYLYRLTESLDKPCSDTNLIVDVAMKDGSRFNVLFGYDISARGSAFTIRKFSEVPISVTQLVKWNTISAEEAAYLWLCLEHGMSAFICGETASGKTTTLKSIASFIRPDAKIFSIEDTPEIFVPHENWQQTVSVGDKATTFDLLKSSLRSRPNYIIVGEIRGKEGNVAFQAMQTGHPVMSTFHAASVQSMIQRFIGDPILVPKDYLSNLNIVLIQQAVYQGEKSLRRCLSINEIEGYYAGTDSIITRTVFEWEPARDIHMFRGRYNSYVLEELVSKKMGFNDKREVYKELDTRAKVIKAMVDKNILDYFKVYDIFVRYLAKGIEGLPFEI